MFPDSKQSFEVSFFSSLLFCFDFWFGLEFGFVFTQEGKQESSFYSTGSCHLVIRTCISSRWIFPNHYFCVERIEKRSVQFSRSVVSDSLPPREPQLARLPCPSPAPGVYSNSCPLSRWWHPTISSPAVPFSSYPQSFPASGSFQMSHLFTSGGQSIGVSASTSVLPMNTQDWSPLGWTGWISIQSKGLSRVFSTTMKDKKMHNCHFVPWSQSRLSQVYNGDQARLWELLKQGFCRNLPQLLFQLDWTKGRYSHSQATLSKNHFLKWNRTRVKNQSRPYPAKVSWYHSWVLNGNASCQCSDISYCPVLCSIEAAVSFLSIVI